MGKVYAFSMDIMETQTGLVKALGESLCFFKTYGATVKLLTAALYSEGVMSNDRIAAFLNTASGGLDLSEGSDYSKDL